jgi:hypothetical protein
MKMTEALARGTYVVLSTDAVRRTTLGLVDLAGLEPDDVERFAWAVATQRLGVALPSFNAAGTMIESEVRRGPARRIGGEEVKPGDWLLRVAWTAAAWVTVKDARYLTLEGVTGGNIVLIASADAVVRSRVGPGSTVADLRAAVARGIAAARR